MRRDEYRKGGPHDDVANNIRNQTQADGMPSAEEVAAERREYLAEKGCKVEGCDEDDPDNLHQQHPHTHSCKAQQQGHPRPDVVCEDHAGNQREEWLEDKKEALKRDDVEALIVYECDSTRVVTTPDEHPEGVPKRYEEPPTAQIKCRCDSVIKNICYADEED